MSRRKKVQELNSIDGKDHYSKIPSVDEVWGFDQSKFPTNDEDKYEKLLNGMNKFDLQQEGLKLGLMPNDAKHIMIERIIGEFSKYKVGEKAARSPNRHQLKVPKYGLDILSEGA